MPPEPNPSPDPAAKGRVLSDEDILGLARGVLNTGGSGKSTPWQPPPVEALQSMLPGYEFLRILGRGGMGAVYLARQLSLNRLVAIKILAAELDDRDMGFAERFKNEAQAMAKLSHPGIVAVYDFGQTASGLLYIVMEYIEGTDVAQMVMNQGRLHSAHAMAIIAHVCDALQYAHARGIIHRDIKPSNIMISNEGVVKVADFGLAKMSQAGGQSVGLTQSGMVMGTLHFMAPEALTLGTAVDQRADIYAVGVMLYQMLTGKLPQGLFEMPSLQVPGLDPRYDGIVAKALREDRDVRYQQASEMRRDLDALMTQPVVKVEPEAPQATAAIPPAQAQPPQRPAGQPYRPPPRRVPMPLRKKFNTGLILAGVGLLAVVAAAVFFLGGKGGHSPIASATKDKPFINTLGMKFVPVPDTKVLFCVHETRRQDYAAYATTVPGVNGQWKNQNNSGIPVGDKDDHPVVAVSWDDAQAFCLWLTERERSSGKLGTNERYRLPSDHEWSCAVGIGSREDSAKLPEEKSLKIPEMFPWGTDYPPHDSQGGNYADSAYHEKFPTGPWLEGYTDGFPTTAPVMSFKPNKLGLYDLGGNVWEWCEDWLNANKSGRVRRGGSWYSNVRHILFSSVRDSMAPASRHDYLGFRVVLETTVPAVAAAAPEKPLDPQLASATKDKPFANTLGMKFVPVPDTKVLFCIHETRYKDYAAFAADAAGVDGTWKDQTKITDRFEIADRPEDHPVTNVSWEDAQKFCAWLSRKEGRTYRLPTDREWSIAVGIGGEEKWNPDTTPATVFKKSTSFPWGNEWPPPNGSGNYSDRSRKTKAPHGHTDASEGNNYYLADYDDGFPTTAPVMSFKPNPFGLYDLGGNAREWVEDKYDNANADRVQRGGCWNFSRRDLLLSSNRGHDIPGYLNIGNGFRVVLAVVSAP